jgi:hypothetical protein
MWLLTGYSPLNTASRSFRGDHLDENDAIGEFAGSFSDEAAVDEAWFMRYP